MTQQIATVDVKVIDQQLDVCTNDYIAAKIGFRYEPQANVWFNVNGQLTDETNVGFTAFYHGIGVEMLTSTAMEAGWQDAFGFECYQGEMYAEEVDQQRNGWQL